MNTPPSPSGAEHTDVSSVRLGALVPLTRPGWVEAGRHLLAGLALAVREVNNAGGIGGRPMELVVRDTAADRERAAAAVDELAGLGVAAVAGDYHSVVARTAAARADALGVPFLCSSAALDALTEEPTEWVARPAPAQSHGWRIYADFFLGAGRRRSAAATQPGVYWASGTRVLRDHLAPRGGAVVELDTNALTPEALCDALVDHGATALLLLVGHPEPAVPMVRAVRGDRQLAGDPDRCSGRTAGVRRMGRGAGRGRRRDPVPALPARAPRSARRTRREGAPRAAGRSALLRRLRGLGHRRRPRRGAASPRHGPGGHRRVMTRA
ncbi:ABC transporter substrate-binding protein [Micromonospora sp. NPDC050397]|uniref:ABC transporter substrate-binding protein n=1 Tax=Micromonospora sp. NPDC050397 TaxID=3364279 RepID=UPI00384CE786